MVVRVVAPVSKQAPDHAILGRRRNFDTPVLPSWQSLHGEVAQCFASEDDEA